MTKCRRLNRDLMVHPVVRTYEKKTMREVPEGIYGATLTASIHAIKYHISWEARDGAQRTNSNGSVAQSSS